MEKALKDLLTNPQSWEYTPDWGSPLRLESFQPIAKENDYAHSFQVKFAFAEEDLTAKLHILPREENSVTDLAHLEVNGELLPWKDPYSFTIGSPAAELAQWVAWIFHIDGESRRQRKQMDFEKTQKWADDSIEGMLTRVELGISNYGRLSTNSNNFANSIEFAAWFKKVNPNPQATILVSELKDLAGYCAQEENSRRYLVSTGETVSEAEVFYSIAWATPQTDNAQGMSAVSQGWVLSSSITILFEGAAIQGHQCLDVLPQTHLKPFLASDPKTALTPAETADKTTKNATGPAPKWYVISFAQLPEYAILCPANEACIDLEWDRDGATIAITVTDETKVVVENMADLKHRRNWSRWYSADANLTEAELAAGIAKAETAFYSLMKAEDQVLEKEKDDQ
ncbi:hypothetical protein NXS08_03070 [Gleimia sp. 6138-11-ORH1]|uniref:hypothetical protein n=1 Tax=Gleimia sp. 6138-11-ORH1 TaxID=2973937 RepID=UPI0021686743|nr:hypothetical protein [Gleimia sp. 6138-11-ORH1]MCS4484470.1 hypothetical protein [Gleimia sp. 6138-11-ORH1]